MIAKQTFRSRSLRLLSTIVLTFGLVGGRSADRGAARAGPAHPGAAAETAPNIVMILTDDEDVQLGSVDYMPNVKKLLSAQGVSFSNMYVPLSLCCPSRTTILRGQYPHNTGVLTNNLPDGGFEKAFAENLETATMATVLHGAGYRTVLLGKYLNGYPDTAPANYIPPGWDEWYSPYAGNPYSEYNYTLNENGTLKVYGATPADYLTDVIRAKAVDFIKRGPPAQPLFVYFATYAPHSPYTPAPRHATLFPDVKAPRPPSFNEPDTTDKPDYIKTRPLLTQNQIDNIDEAYRNRLRALQAVDEAIGDLVATLSSTGRLSNTYIVFTADNGYHMGEHRLLPGKYTPYETDLHVPLVIRGPGVVPGVVRTQFVGNLDLAPTFADFAGAPPLPFFDGRSLKPLLGPSVPSAWRRAFLLEEFNQGQTVIIDPDKTDPASKQGVREPPDPAEIEEAVIPPIPTYYGFQTPDYKYVEYLTTAGDIKEKEIYVSWDPYERNNIAPKVNQNFSDALEAYVLTLSACKTDSCRSAEAQPPPPLPSAFFPANTNLVLDGQPGDKRFTAQVSFATSQGGGIVGDGHAVQLSAVGVERGGAFWFFSADNPEMLVKVVDGCAANGQKWLFASAGTNVGYTLTVRDAVTGQQKTYTNPDLKAALPIQDTAFEPCPAVSVPSGGSSATAAPAAVKPAAADEPREPWTVKTASTAAAPCVAGPTTLCIDGAPGDKRFKVEIAYQTAQGGGLSGKGQAIPLASLGIAHGGAFWFFSADNPEMLVKVVDGCPANGNKWFFASAGTNVGMTVTVTDTTTGAQRVYTNPDLNPAAPIQDTAAFSTCP
jgi:arylsulfatase A-like enzyme/uncharacterized metal-binding protein